MCGNLSNILSVPLDLDLKSCLDFPDLHAFNAEHQRRYKLLTSAAWKNSLFSWIKDKEVLAQCHNGVFSEQEGFLSAAFISGGFLLGSEVPDPVQPLFLLNYH